MVLPSLWPRKKNTRGPMGEEEDVIGVGGGMAGGMGLGMTATGEQSEETATPTRDPRQEAMREIEEERRVAADERLRWRGHAESRGGGGGGGGYEMTGGMPG